MGRAIRSERKSDKWTDKLRTAGVGEAGGGVRVSHVTGDVDETGPSNNTHSELYLDQRAILPTSASMPTAGCSFQHRVVFIRAALFH